MEKGQTMYQIRQDLTRTTLAVLFIGLLLITSFWIVRPFLPATIWATMLVIATWPTMRLIQSVLWNSRFLAVAIMILLLVVVFVVPFIFAITSIVEHINVIASWPEALAAFHMPPPPEWLVQLPVIGEAASRAWENVAALQATEVVKKAAPYAFDATKWIIGQAGSVGALMMHLLLTIIVAGVLYSYGEQAASLLCRFGNRLAGEQGEDSVHLAGNAIRGVALAVVVTALAQSAFAGIGLLVAGVPFAPVLIAIVFALCIAQLGPSLILLPAVVWMYWKGNAGWATLLLIWSVPVIIMDNFLRPVLVKRGADLPFLLIIVGVIGGLIGFGLIGIFVGPVILAVAYTLLATWMDQKTQ